MNYHLVGVGGVGMSALAQLLVAAGCRVSGSDRYHDQGREIDVLKKLRSLGVNLVAQDGSAVRDNTTAVIVSTAIENDNLDIAAARLKKIPIVHRAAMLADLARGRQCVAVTGTAGKSTVTGMIGWTFEQMGLDPTVVNGAPVLNWVSERNPGNFRFGRSNLWVMELDESDRSLLNFFPDWAVITNISKDHFELAEVRQLFALFAGQVRKGIVGPGFDGGYAEASCDPLKHKNLKKVGTDSLVRPYEWQKCGGTGCPAIPGNSSRLWRSNLIGIVNPGVDFQPVVTERGVAFQYRNVKFQLSLLGKHNAENALHCVLLCERLGLDLQKVADALKKFTGIERRLEVIGQAGGITVIDDYAHNPAKITAAWQALAPFYRRITAVWRPHGYGPLALMRGELTEVFKKNIRPEDRIIIMSVYFAGGTANKEVTARMLADDLKQNGLPAAYVENYEELLPVLLKSTAAGGAVLLMGARDPDLPVFARSLVFKFNDFIMNRVPGAGGITKKNEATDQAQRDCYEINHE